MTEKTRGIFLIIRADFYVVSSSEYTATNDGTTNE
jgi:hypothetical protein